jgi:hypothetical protein
VFTKEITKVFFLVAAFVLMEIPNVFLMELLVKSQSNPRMLQVFSGLVPIALVLIALVLIALVLIALVPISGHHVMKMNLVWFFAEFGTS